MSNWKVVYFDLFHHCNWLEYVGKFIPFQKEKLHNL